MKKYHKIETLFTFNQETKRFNYGEYYNPYVEYLKDCKWIFTEKVDGTNFRLYWDGHTLQYGGRTEKSQFSKQQIKFIDDKLCNEYTTQIFEHMFGEKEVYVFGELFGSNIQKVGKLYSEELQFKVFDIMINDFYLSKKDVAEVSFGLGFKVVPFILEGTIDDALDYVYNNDKSTFSEAPLEGLVGVPRLGLFDKQGKRIIVKIKKRDMVKI